MREDLLVRRMREAIRKGAKIPPKERFEDMVRRGVIDEKGRVLIRMPEPPKMKRMPKKKKADTTAPPPTSDNANGEVPILSEEMLLQRLREAIRKGAKVPTEVRHRELVEAGIIDEQGNVLVRMPEPPKTKRTKKKKPQTGS